MKELQAFSREYQKEMQWEIKKDTYSVSRESLLNNYMLLTTEMAEVAEELRKVFNITNYNIQKGMDENEAFSIGKKEIKEDLGKELADCLAYILKIANFFDIELEDSFYLKMEGVKNRKNKDIPIK